MIVEFRKVYNFIWLSVSVKQFSDEDLEVGL